MEIDDFVGQYARYLTLKLHERNLSAEEKREKDLIYTNIKNYVVTGEELLEEDLLGRFPEGFFKDKETEKYLEKLTSKLERIKGEIGDKQGTLIERIKSILTSE